MAIFYPTMEEIMELKVKPTAGELYLLRFLEEQLDDNYNVYFQPYLNGDQPDIVILRRDAGGMIIEVKDWDLDHYHVVDEDTWLVKNSRIRSPLKQVETYKSNLYTMHTVGLTKANILNWNAYGLIKTAVYFHRETTGRVRTKVGSHRNKYVLLLGRDVMTTELFPMILKSCRLHAPSEFFPKELYNELHRCFQPSVHTLEIGKHIDYNEAQLRLCESKPGEYKVKGVAGSGKTAVLAKRAVNAHIRTGKNVLILTFNITLRNYIRDQISNVRNGEFKNAFHIVHYHQFIKSVLNNHNLERVHHDNVGFFIENRDMFPKYDVILIDEIQDYYIEWQRIIKGAFLSEGGELVVFGDEKQNVYERALDERKRPQTVIRGRWNELKQSYRISNRIVELATEFQQHFLKKRYECDEFQLALDLYGVEERLHYKYNEDKMTALVQALQHFTSKGVHYNDICILATDIDFLRFAEEALFLNYDIKTTTTFETEKEYESLERKHDFEKQLHKIRRSKKMNFQMNSGTIKLSTIHSFKGWEMTNLILVIPRTSNAIVGDEQEKIALEELVYTGITRCRQNMFIINEGNRNMHRFFEKQRTLFDVWEGDVVEREFVFK